MVIYNLMANFNSKDRNITCIHFIHALRSVLLLKRSLCQDHNIL